MNVVFIARNFPPDIGGAEKLNYNLIQNLKKLTHVKVVVNKYGKYSLAFYINSLWKGLLDKEVDIFFLSDSLLSPLIPVFKILKRKPVIIKIHGLDITFPSKLYQIFIPKFTSLADRIICISNATKQECIKRGISEDKITIIPVGISDKVYLRDDKDLIKNRLEERLNISLKKKKILLSVGRLVKRKGFHWFVENAIPKMLKRRIDFIYLIVGDGQYKERIKNTIEKRDLEKHVVILGKVSEDVLKLLYNIADVFIIPNIPVKGDTEGFGIVAIEAASCGLPVVASNLEGIKDAIKDGKNGFLVESYNADGFIDVINKLLGGDENRKEFGKRAREFTKKHYNWNKITQKYLNELQSLIKS